ncbi:MAG: hypothetical protein ACXWU0_06295 [Rhodoplanes sp.]
MPEFDFGTETLSVMTWVAGGLAALLLAAAVFAWRRTPGLTAIAAVLALALAGGAAFLLLRDRVQLENRAERQAFARRADELAARAITPNSPLACLNARAGPTVESACEALIFGRPETVAAAVSYVAAKVALVSDGAAAAGGDAAAAGTAVAALQRELEADRFGIVAHVLAVSFACDADRCAAFALVADPAQIRTNLRERTFDRLVARHAATWPSGEHKPAVSETAPLRGAAPLPSSPPLVAKPLSPGQDFPSAASIPPVSIMTPEPPRPPEPAAAGGDGPAAQPSAPRKPGAAPPLPRPAPRTSTGPVSIAPPRPSAPAASTNAPGQN